jgi:sporulation protein YlmC with PRC-barrel domain
MGQVLLVVGALAAAAGCAWAEGVSTSAPGPASNILAERMQPGEIRASKLIGSDVYGLDNRRIGDISDLVVDPGGRIAAAVLSVGGFLGIGEKHVAVKMGELKRGVDDRLTVNMTKEQLAAAPPYSYTERAAPAGGSAGSRAPGPRAGAGTATPPAGRMQ